jgi:hypothetical protein
MAAVQGICLQLDGGRSILEHTSREEQLMKASQSVFAQGTASGEDIERYDVIDGVCVVQELIGAFETVLPRGCVIW